MSFQVLGETVNLFYFPPETPVKENLEFLTDVMEHRNGSEQRVSLRKNPRQAFDLTVFVDDVNDRQYLENLLLGWKDRVFALPVFPETRRLTVAATATDTSITVDEDDYADFRVGSLIGLFTDRQTFDVKVINTLPGAGVITLTAGLDNGYPVGTHVWPVRLAQAIAVNQGGKSPINRQKVNIRFLCRDNDSDLADVSAYDSFIPDPIAGTSKVILTDQNFIEGELREAFEQRLEILDGLTGTFDLATTRDIGRRITAKGFSTQTPQGLWQARQLLHALRGRQVSFYLPTFFGFDLTPQANLTQGSDQIQVAHVGYTEFIQRQVPRRYFRLVKTDGTVLIRRINGSVETSPTVETLTVDFPWPSNITIAEIDRIEFIEEVRADTDRFTIRHADEIGSAKILFPVKTVIEGPTEEHVVQVFAEEKGDVFDSVSSSYQTVWTKTIAADALDVDGDVITVTLKILFGDPTDQDDSYLYQWRINGNPLGEIGIVPIYTSEAYMMHRHTLDLTRMTSSIILADSLDNGNNTIPMPALGGPQLTNSNHNTGKGNRRLTSFDFTQPFTIDLQMKAQAFETPFNSTWQKLSAHAFKYKAG